MRQYLAFSSVSVVVFAALFLISWSASAAIIRMDNRPGRPSDFPDLRTAVSKAKAGDTIFVSGSPDTYGVGNEIVIDKKLTLIGPGYSIGENYPEHAAAQQDATLESVRVTEGGADSQLKGLKIPSLVGDGDRLLVKRCLLSRCVFGESRLVIGPRLQQCAVIGDYNSGWLHFHARDAVVSNNLIRLISPNYAHRAIGDWGGAGRSAATAHFSHNTIVGESSGKAFTKRKFTFSSNVIYLESERAVADFLLAYQPDESNNVIGTEALAAGTFLGEGSIDRMWQLGLTAENPARGKGEFGEDCGAFGGSTPYVMSGIPSLPYFELFKAESTVGPSGNLKVRLRAVGGE